jgi:hypothetical protein
MRIEFVWSAIVFIAFYPVAAAFRGTRKNVI